MSRGDGDTEPVIFRWQYLYKGFEVYFPESADTMRAWEGVRGDRCLLEVTQTVAGDWRPVGGVAGWDALTGTYRSPAAALAALLGGRAHREATEDDL